MNEPQEWGDEPRSFWARLRDRFGIGMDGEEISDEAFGASQPRQASLRLDSARQIRISIRSNMGGFAEATAAADGLKSGEQQIVNLEQTPQELAERMVDFLSGVAYALDGSVERIGERVYLFAPANVRIQLQEGEAEPAAMIG